MWVWALAVVEGHSIADHAQGMHLRFEAVPVNALFLQGTYHSFQHAVVMRAVRWRGATQNRAAAAPPPRRSDRRCGNALPAGA